MLHSYLNFCSSGSATEKPSSLKMIEKMGEDDLEEEAKQEERKKRLLLQCQDALTRAGLFLDSSDQVAAVLETWQPEEGEVTNGIIAGLVGSYINISKFMTRMILRYLKINPDRSTKSVEDRIRFFFKDTMRFVSEINISQPWNCLEELRRSGGYLEKAGLWKKCSLYDQVTRGLVMRRVAEERKCEHCGYLGDLPWCGGCWSTFYCGQECLERGWEEGHREACSKLAKTTLQGGVLICPGVAERERQQKNRANKVTGLARQWKQEVQELSRCLDELAAGKAGAEEDIVDLSVAVEELRDKVKKIEKSNAGLRSVLAKKRRSSQGEGSQEPEESPTKMVRMSPLKSQHLEMYSGEEVRGAGRVYGSSTYIRLNDSRQPGLSTAVSENTVRQRAHQTFEVMGTMSGHRQLGKEEQEQQVTKTAGSLVKLYTPIFKSAILTTPGLFNNLMRMDISTSSEMMASINMTVSERRKLNLMFEKLYSFRPLSPEAKQRAHDRELADVITR